MSATDRMNRMAVRAVQEALTHLWANATRNYASGTFKAWSDGYGEGQVNMVAIMLGADPKEVKEALQAHVDVVNATDTYEGSPYKMIERQAQVFVGSYL